MKFLLCLSLFCFFVVLTTRSTAYVIFQNPEEEEIIVRKLQRNKDADAMYETMKNKNVPYQGRHVIQYITRKEEPPVLEQQDESNADVEELSDDDQRMLEIEQAHNKEYFDARPEEADILSVKLDLKPMRLTPSTPITSIVNEVLSKLLEIEILHTDPLAEERRRMASIREDLAEIKQEQKVQREMISDFLDVCDGYTSKEDGDEEDRKSSFRKQLSSLFNSFQRPREVRVEYNDYRGLIEEINKEAQEIKND